MSLDHFLTFHFTLPMSSASCTEFALTPPANGMVKMKYGQPAIDRRSAESSVSMLRRKFLARTLGFLTVPSLPLGAQGVASRGVRPLPRGKPSGLPFHAHFTDIAK